MDANVARTLPAHEQVIASSAKSMHELVTDRVLRLYEGV